MPTTWIETGHLTMNLRSPIQRDETLIVHGVKVAVDPEVMSKTMLRVLRTAEYEKEESRQIPGIVQPGDRIVELGGGIGFISSLAFLQNKAAEITVYEADPRLIPVIERTHALNGVKADVINAVVLPKKVSATVPFYVRADFWASSLSPTPYGYERAVDVPVVAFTDLLDERKPTFLIIDIEGGEDFLLRDVPLTGVTKVFIETHQAILGRVGMKRLFDFFSERDFHYDQWHSSHGVVLFSHVLR